MVKRTTLPEFAGDDEIVVRLRKRHWGAYQRLGGWMRLAAKLDVNVGIIYRFVVYGKEPREHGLRKAIGLRVFPKRPQKPHEPAPEWLRSWRKLTKDERKNLIMGWLANNGKL